MGESGREKEIVGERVGEEWGERFSQMSFEEAIRKGNFPKDVPFVAGFTSEEGLVISIY